MTSQTLDGGSKTLYVQLNAPGGADWSQVLGDPEAVEHMGVRCIRGTLRTTTDTYFLSGRTVYIPVDRILFMVEYPSWEAYREAVRRHYEAKSQ